MVGAGGVYEFIKFLLKNKSRLLELIPIYYIILCKIQKKIKTFENLSLILYYIILLQRKKYPCHLKLLLHSH